MSESPPVQGRARFHGLDIVIENDAATMRAPLDGSMRWKTLMRYPYGYIEGTLGMDGDEVDCYLGPNVHSETVFIIDQLDPASGSLDEQKVMLGFDTPGEAKAAYLLHFDNPDAFGAVRTLPIARFKRLVLGEARGKMVKAEQVEVARDSASAASSAERTRARDKLAGVTMDLEQLDRQAHRLAGAMDRTASNFARRSEELASNVRDPGDVDAGDAWLEHAEEARRSRAVASVLRRRTTRR